jgi:hypothetical protein
MDKPTHIALDVRNLEIPLYLGGGGPKMNQSLSYSRTDAHPGMALYQVIEPSEKGAKAHVELVWLNTA